MLPSENLAPDCLVLVKSRANREKTSFVYLLDFVNTDLQGSIQPPDRTSLCYISCPIISMNEGDQDPINMGNNHEINNWFRHLVLDDPSGSLGYQSLRAP